MAKATTKRVFQPGITGIGTLVYPKIIRPDTKGKFADNKFKTEFVLDDKKTSEALFKDLCAKAKELAGKDYNEKDASGIPVKKTKQGKVVRDEDSNLVFKFKSSKRPVIVDAKRKRLPKGVEVRGGSRGRVSYTLTNYDEGVVMLLDAVQITELVQGSPGANAFDETDGFDGSELEEYEDFGGESGEGGSDEGDEDADEAPAKDKFAL